MIMDPKLLKKLRAALKEYNTEIKTERIEGDFVDPRGVERKDLPGIERIMLTTRFGSGRCCHELWLPDAWNGRFLGLGSGGMAGAISYPDLVYRAKEGYTVAHTDMGTSKGVKSGIDNRDVSRDFGWRATYIMSIVGKMITEEYYGRKPDYSYFMGASTGGQQSLAMAQRCPECYDAIWAGAPANNRTHLHTYFLWSYVVTRKYDVRFEQAEIDVITEKAVEYSKDNGNSDPEDKFVTRICCDDEYIDGFIGYLKENYHELPEAKRNALREMYIGPVNPVTGEKIYNGIPIGAEQVGVLEMQRDTPHMYPFIWTFGKGFNRTDFDFAADMDEVDRELAGDMNANDTDLSPFFDRGGKLFILTGSVDPIVPSHNTMDYYRRVTEKAGGLDKIYSQARCFIMPGQDHGRCNMILNGNAVMNGNIVLDKEKDVYDYQYRIMELWCEKGVAPEYFDVIAGMENTQVPKRIYAYGTANDPFTDLPACGEKYIR